MLFRKIIKIGGIEVLLAVNNSVVNLIRSSPLWRGSKGHPDQVQCATPGEGEGAALPMNQSPDERQAIRDKIKATKWYHSIDLGGGIKTPGVFDHEPYLAQYHLPESLHGKRALDVATCDGFWAFQFEKLGAAEVVAMDIETLNDLDLLPRLRTELPAEVLSHKTGDSFNLAKEILGSSVQRKTMNAYEISPERLGRFDFVFCSDMIAHLLNPLAALQSIYSVVDGYALFVETYNPHLPGKTAIYRGGVEQCVWWSYSYECLEQMIRDAGFRDVTLLNTFKLGHRGDKPWISHAVLQARP